MSLRTTLRLPREHGAWAMLYIPFILGALVGGAMSLPVVLLLLASSALFFSRESLLVWWRARHRGRDAGNAGKMLVIYWLLALLCGLPLLVWFRLWLLLPMALVGLSLLAINGMHALEMEDRSIRAEILAIAAMALTAPAAFYTARGYWAITALWLWVLCVLFFVSSVYYIRLRVLSLNPRKAATRRQVGVYCAAYHLFLLIALVVLAVTRNLQLFAVIAFVPALLRTFWNFIQPSSQVNLKRAGMLELVWSLVFLVFITLAFRT